MGPGRPRLAWHSFAVPKAGLTREEYEDACAGAADSGRFAIADGATEASFAGTWAALLVQHFTRAAGPWQAWLPAARQDWLDSIPPGECPWYAEQKLEEGAFATFLGVTFSSLRAAEASIPEAPAWTAAAVGDSCLFQVRGQQLLRAFPMRRACNFGSSPPLLGSRKHTLKVKRLHWRGDWLPDDHLFLMTDALAQWFLQNVESTRKPWNDVLALTSQEMFEAWIATLRNTGALRNDDTTLMVIKGLQESDEG